MKNRILLFQFFILPLVLLYSASTFSQAGMTASPGKLYYRFAPGGAGTQKIIVQNPNDKELEIGVSLSDWNYDSTGGNQIYEAGSLKNSCADWIKILPASYFTLQPNERRELDVVVSAPANADTAIPVHTAMVYLSQLNPGNATTSDGASIKVTVKIGVKIYHAFTTLNERGLEIMDFSKTDGNNPLQRELELQLKNTGKLWLDGKVNLELLNVQTGKKIKLEPVSFYALPGDFRRLKLPLAPDLAAGDYTATAVVNYGDKDELKLAELDFSIN